MKNVKIFISAIVLTLFVSSTAMASTSTETTSKNKLRTELIKLLGDYELSFDQQTLTANVSFIVNDKNEVVILSVRSKDENIQSYVKSKLNYKKIDCSGITKGKIYVMPLKIENPN